MEIRRAYRELSKRYHPDTTDLPLEVALEKFKRLNEAYATLSNPQRRLLYDQSHGFSPLNVIQAPQAIREEEAAGMRVSSAYLDPVDRPLSAGEVFALFMLGLTFLGCILLVIGIALLRGDAL